jgi:hypothetical protein
MKRLALLAATLLLGVGLAAPALSASQGNSAHTWGHSRPMKLQRASTAEVASGSVRKMSAAARLYRKQGYLVPNQAAYERAKAAAAARAGQGAPSAAPRRAAAKAGAPLIQSGDPDIFPAWNGQANPDITPPDTTGAIGPTRYVTTVNTRFGIYDRSGNVLTSGGLRDFAGANTDCVTDPQVIWDPQTNRFYYEVLEYSHFVGNDCTFPSPGPPNDANQLFIGFSRTSSPSTGSDSSWCKYVLPYFQDLPDFDALPDYPKLGDTSAFLLIGSNLFDPGYIGSDVAWITKPGSGTSCPELLANHLPGALLDHNGNPAFTPVPANQTDTSSTGYVVATPDPDNPDNSIESYSVSADFFDPIGAAVAHNVTPFAVPPSAPQAGTAATLDTLDARLTNAVSSVDPSEGTTAVWTQHTVAGGAGSEARWYEIEPSTSSPLRSGSVSDPLLYVFNAAISSDRKVSGTTKRFGDAFVIGFNTSSASDFVHIQMVSQWADYPMSEFVDVKASPGFNDDFTCGGCRWGDYSGASPDPASSPYSNHGRVWLANQWNVESESPDPLGNVDWRTYIWGTNPVPFVVLNGPTVQFQKSKSFPVSWTLGNQASAADVQYRAAPWNGPFGSPVLWQDKVPAGSATFTGNYARTYCFSAQSYDDVAGPDLRPWGFGAERCAVIPMDDRNLTASSGWSRLTGSGFFRGTYTRSSTLGKSLTKSGIHGKRIYVMVEKCSTCGSIKIYWNGSLKHTYSLHSSRTRKRIFLLGASFSTVQDGTLKIVVSSSGKPVIIDALSVSLV